MRKYFGTDGIRGVVGEYPITPDFALHLGYAAGIVLGNLGTKPTVIIGKDTRLSGYLFESSLEAGFSYAGVNVYMAGPIPTPAIAYLTHNLNLSAGVVISASHNPYTDNGIKFFSSQGTKLSDDIELAIEEQLDKPMQIAASLGKVSRLNDALESYAQFCKQVVPQLSLAGLTIVVDCAHGATYHVAPQILTDLGAHVITLGCNPDGTNINLACGSTHPELLAKTVVASKADFGVAFDGDGDRVMFVDSAGTPYNGDKLLYILAKHKLSVEPLPGIVGTVMSNLALEHALAKHNVELVRAQVGDRYVFEALTKYGWHLGGEASGHILCLDKHTTGDGIISMLLVISAMLGLNQPLHNLIDWADYPQTLINVALNMTSVNDWHQKINPILTTATKELEGSGRVIVRKSGTEPLVRVMVEAKDSKTSNYWAETIATSLINS